MSLKINFFQGSTLGGMFRIFLAGILFLCIGETDVCSGAKIDELNRNSTFHQKFSPGKAIKYYKSIENGTNLVPLTYDRLVFHKQSIKSIEKYNWALTLNNNQHIPNTRSSVLEIPLEVPAQYLKKSFKNTRTLYLDYTEEYLDARNIKHKDVRHSIVMLQIFIKNSRLNRKWVIYAPFLYIGGQIDLPEKWAPKNIWYQIRRELGLPPNNVGRFSHELNSSFFKIRLHERINNYYGVKITVDGSNSLPVENLWPRDAKKFSLMRVGGRDDFNYSGVITMDATLSNHQNNLVATSYLSNDYSEIKLKDESNVYLEELTFNFPLLEPPSNLVSFVKNISFYKSSRDKIIANYNDNLFEPIILNPSFIRDMGEGIGRLGVGLSNLSDKLKKRILADGTKILKASLILDTRESRVQKVWIYKKSFLKFRNAPELVIFKNKKYLNSQDLLDRVQVPIDQVIKITPSPLNWLSPYIFRGNTSAFNILLFIFYFAAIIFCFIRFKNYKKVLTDIRCLVTTFFDQLHARSNYFACLGLFMCFLGLLISLFTGAEPFNQVYDVNFVFKDILYSLGGLVLAVNWKYQCVKIYMFLKPTRLEILKDLFKNDNYSYLTGIFVFLFLCIISRQLYLPLVEAFSSISISFMLVGAYHYFYQKTGCHGGVSSTDN